MKKKIQNDLKIDIKLFIEIENSILYYKVDNYYL